MGIVTTTTTSTVNTVTVTTKTTVVSFTDYAAAKVSCVGRFKLPMGAPGVKSVPSSTYDDSGIGLTMRDARARYGMPFSNYDKTQCPADNQVLQSLDRMTAEGAAYTAGAVSDHIKPLTEYPSASPFKIYNENQTTNPVGDGFGIIFQDQYILYVPSRPNHWGGPDSGWWPDFAVDVDLPYPWGNCRLVYQSGIPFLSARTPPSGWTVNTRRRHASDTYTWQFEGRGNAIFPYDSRQDPNGVSGLTIPYTASDLPSFYFTGTEAVDIYFTNGWTVEGQWYRVNYNKWTFGLDYEKIGSAFSMSATPIGDTSGGYTPSIVVDNQTLPAPSIPSPGRYGLALQVTIKGDYDLDMFGAIPRGAPHHSTSSLILGTPFVFGYQPPTYWPFTVPLVQLAENESGITFVRHAGYLPPAATDQFAITEVAPTLVRTGDIVYISTGGWSFPTDPRDAYPVVSTLAGQFHLESHTGCFRIVCPDLGTEYLTEFQLDFNYPTPLELRHFPSKNLPQIGTDPYTGDPILTDYPGPSVYLPPETAGKALYCEVVTAQVMQCCGGQRRTIKKWIVSVP